MGRRRKRMEQDRRKNVNLNASDYDAALGTAEGGAAILTQHLYSFAASRLPSFAYPLETELLKK